MFFALDLFVWHLSIARVGPGLATLLGNFQVFVVVALAAFLLRERLSVGLALAIPIALVGLGLIVGIEALTKSEATRAGVVYGLMTALFYGSYILSLQQGRRLAVGSPSVLDLAIVSLVSAVLLLAGALVAGDRITLDDPLEWGYMVGYALVAQVIGWGLITYALPRLKASIVGLLLLLQPVLAFTWDVLFFDRAFGLRESVGMTLALGAILYGSRAQRKPPRS